MSYQISIKKHTLQFRFEARTSRGSLFEKDTFFISLTHSENPEVIGIGECSPLKGLSPEYDDNYEERLNYFCKLFKEMNNPEGFFKHPTLPSVPSIRFGFEMAWKDLQNGGKRSFYPNRFIEGKPLPINGLIWMGSHEFMLQQIKEKLEAGFGCIKIKVGAIDFEQELSLLHYIRQQYGPEDITLRVDANGAFSPTDAEDKLKALTKYQLHSIEQPIKAGQIEAMATLCENTPLPIALDEELIGIQHVEQFSPLLKAIQPSYIILKPSLVGGFNATQAWIEAAENLGIGWWVTSALESNIGLNAICQLTANYPVTIPQGLGTGQLYHNNIDSPLEVKAGEITYLQTESPNWGIEVFD